MNQVAQSTAPALTQLSAGLRILRDVSARFALEAAMTGEAHVDRLSALMMFEGVDKMCHLAAGVLAAEVARLSAEPVNPAPTQQEVAAARPSMTKDEYLRSWSEPRDAAGVAQLKDMAQGDGPNVLPRGYVVLKGSPEQIQAQVTDLLNSAFRQRPSSAH
jgi:hypothetical protein